MYNGFLHLHSVLRWVLLIILLIAIYKSFADRRKPFTPGHRKAGMFAMICADIMLLIGLYQWFAGPLGLKSIQSNGVSVVMKDPVLRFYAFEHTIGMLIAIALIHIGYSYAKKIIDDTVKHRRAIVFYGLALLIILISIPWPFRMVGAGRHWLPGL
ncbi:MAG TPA: hypothetical protein PLU37_08380 [Chitinophagaceae bacterium]|nr:hypothetical protein [Chitinophagaceae bacterium]HPG11531.1 hypothetical protein [Chitinophagaceae bacterium]HRX93993.1 hypothetical protein [Chitinophagaceae bacterium]